jgi:3'-phosphoadenosine 5'-phosphosulfate sulfotransferase (PAPS reductase)/FAD synthetase
MTLNTAPLQTLHADFHDLTLDEALVALRQRFDGRIAFSTSLGLEDQVITDAIFRNGLDIEVFTLDTGRNFKETYDTLDATRKKYGQPIKTFYPQTLAIEHYVTIKGINAIYLWGYIRKYDIPYNKLHGEGFPSIGCAPCTRAITQGEDERAGRWWWESHNQECGLHDGTRNPLRKAA